MKKLDVQISKITEVKNPIYYGDDLLHLYIHTEQASYIQFFAWICFTTQTILMSYLHVFLNKKQGETIHLENGLLIQSLKKYLSKN